jgi:hypothetical protein
LFSGVVVAAAHALAYLGFKKFKSTKHKSRMREYEVGLSRYETKISEISTYIRENQIFINSSFNNENRTMGLVIIEAYYGLADHIY